MPFTPYQPNQHGVFTSQQGHFTPYKPQVNPIQAHTQMRKQMAQNLGLPDPTQEDPRMQGVNQGVAGNFNLGSGIKQTAQNLAQPIISGAKEFTNDTSQAFQGGINQIKQGAGQVNQGNPFEGALTMGAGAVNTAFSPLVAPFKPVSNAVNYAADKISDNPTVQKFANSKAGQITARGAEDVGNLATIAQGVGGFMGAPELATKGEAGINTVAEAAKPGLKAVGQDIAEGAGKVANAAKKVGDTTITGAKAVKQTISPTLSPEEATGQVIQGQTSDVPAAHRTLANLDTKGVKTYSDLQSKLDSHIKTLSKAQDTLLSADGRTFKIQQLATKVGKVAHNYVNDALGQLKDYFTKTNDIANSQKIQKLIDKTNPTKGTGLTLKDVNDIAKMHGSKLNAYNANGELASGLTRQAAENTRMGLKNTVRNLLPNDTSKTIDAQISDALNTKDLIDKQTEKVNTATQKTPKQGIVPKLVSKGIHAADYITGSPLKAIGKELGTSRGSSTLSPTEIEGNLGKNLKTIRNAK